MKTIQIREYGTFVVGERNGSNVGGNITLTKRTFEQLENFILSNSSKETDALELMGLSARRGVGKIITAKNYVGIITMNDGTAIEILPKVYSAIEDDSGASRTKKLLIDMLKTLRDAPYKALQPCCGEIWTYQSSQLAPRIGAIICLKSLKPSSK